MTAPVALFDFDGTLCDDFSEALIILNALAGEFGYRKIDLSKREEARATETRELMRSLGIKIYQLPFIAARARSELQKKIPELRPVPGIAAALEQLSQGGVRMGIVTSNSEENVRTFLTRNGMDRFEFVAAGSSIFGKARFIRHLMSANGIAPESAWYVGDETRDVDAARKAGVRVVSVSWGFNSRAALEKKGPDFLLDSPAELLVSLRGGPKGRRGNLEDRSD